eukprot:5083760-Pleurochrysis_carterae.AAC.1
MLCNGRKIIRGQYDFAGIVTTSHVEGGRGGSLSTGTESSLEQGNIYLGLSGAERAGIHMLSQQLWQAKHNARNGG